MKVRDGFHLWSERCDRDMKDAFDSQDDISRACFLGSDVPAGFFARGAGEDGRSAEGDP